MIDFPLPKALLLCLIVFFSCNPSDRPEQVKDNLGTRPAVTADTFFVSNEKSEIVIGRIMDLAVDSEESVYILDPGGYTVWKFNKDGEFESNLLSGPGKGPGETTRPTSIAVDNKGNLYATDLMLNKILIVNEYGDPVSEAVLSMRPTIVAAGDLNAVYVTGFRFSISDHLVYRLTPSKTGTYSITDRFVEQWEEDRSHGIQMAGWSDYITTTSDGGIFVSRFYPYHIQKFNSDLELQFTVEREVEFITKPELNNQGIVTVTGVMREVLPIDNGRFLVRYSRMDEEQKFTSYLDLFNATGTYVETYSFRELGIKEDIRTMVSVPGKAVLYAAYNNPWPGVIRYSIKFD